MAKKFDFKRACTELLQQLGASKSVDIFAREWTLQTLAGPMYCDVYDTWLASRFADVNAAKTTISSGSLNPFSGKWNWHYTEPTQYDIDDLRVQLLRILPVQIPYECVYCGRPSWVDPTDQRPPPDYCHESDHGEPDEFEPDEPVRETIGHNAHRGQRN